MKKLQKNNYIHNSVSLNTIDARIEHLEQKKYIIRFLNKIVILIFSVTFLFQVIFGLTIVKGNSMHPFLQDGDIAFYMRLTSQYIVGDIIFIHMEGKNFFSRIVAYSGDEVHITKEGYFYINGHIQYENIDYPEFYENNDIQFPYIIPEGKVFVLNDFNLNFEDSRKYGAIDRAHIQGKLFSIFRFRIYEIS